MFVNNVNWSLAKPFCIHIRKHLRHGKNPSEQASSSNSDNDLQIQTEHEDGCDMCGCLVSDEFGLLLEGGGAARHIALQIFPIVFLNTRLHYSIYNIQYTYRSENHIVVACDLQILFFCLRFSLYLSFLLFSFKFDCFFLIPQFTSAYLEKGGGGEPKIPTIF